MTSAKQEPDRPVDTTGMAAQPRRTDPDFDLLIQHASRTLDPATAVRFPRPETALHRLRRCPAAGPAD